MPILAGSEAIVSFCAELHKSNGWGAVPGTHLSPGIAASERDPLQTCLLPCSHPLALILISDVAEGAACFPLGAVEQHLPLWLETVVDNSPIRNLLMDRR